MDASGIFVEAPYEMKVVQYQAQGPNNVVKLRRRIHQRVGLDALVLG
jgi:hypothetical protein